MKNEKVKIEVWSNIVCPFCYIGKKRIEQTVNELNVKDDVEIIWHSYLLYPSFPMDTSMEYYPYYNKNTDYTEAQLRPLGQRLNVIGEPYGIRFNFDNVYVVNTFNLHRLLFWSKEYGLYNELNEAFMQAYFTDGVDLSKEDQLLEVVDSVRLSLSQAKTILSSNQYKSEVTTDISRSREVGVSGVPYFLINGTGKISGAQDNSIFAKAILKAISQNENKVETKNKGICLPNSNCKID